jgi:CRISPR-associated protein Csd1
MLSAWNSSPHSHPKVQAVLNYVKKAHVIQDLVANGILPVDSNGKVLKTWNGKAQEAPPIFKVIANPEDSFVRWRVEASNDLETGTWEDRALVQAWIAYYASQQSKRGLCFVAAEESTLAEQHPAKIRSARDKAKLISSNDTTGYTFRGRFLEGDQACGVGFAVTQKAHNALRWLLARQGHHNGDQTIVAWTVSGKSIPDPFANTSELFGVDAVPDQTGSASLGDAGQAFGRRLSKAIAGYRADLGSTEGVALIGLDSATPGRLAITSYRELTGSEFLDRVQDWHQSFAWHQEYGWDSERKRALRFLGAPSPKDIADAAFGPPRDKTKTLHKATVERLLPCIIDGRPVPRDLVESAVRRTTHRAGFARDKKGKEWEWEKNLGIACALFSGSHKGEYHMTLETGRTSRDYLYGRLLAIAEHIEGRALYVAGESRDTTAAKLMQRFSDRPYSTWRLIEPALVPYKSRLKAKRPAYLHTVERLMDAVVCSFPAETFQDDRRLTGEFLLGYHCQRQDLLPPKDRPTGDTDDSPETDQTPEAES